MEMLNNSTLPQGYGGREGGKLMKLKPYTQPPQKETELFDLINTSL